MSASRLLIGLPVLTVVFVFVLAWMYESDPRGESGDTLVAALGPSAQVEDDAPWGAQDVPTRALAADPRAARVDREGIVREPFGARRILVSDSGSGRPLVGARVVEARAGVELARACERGLVEVSIESLRHGIVVEADAHAARALDERRLAALPWDGERGAWRLELTGQATLELEVVGRQGQGPLAEIELWLGATSARSALNGGQGDVALDHLHVGGWRRSLYVSHPVDHAAFLGRTDAQGRLSIAEVPVGHELFLVARSTHVLERRLLRVGSAGARLRIEAEVGRLVRGRLVWDDGRPLEKGWLRVHDGTAIEELTLGSDGSFHLPRVRSNTLRLQLLLPVPHDLVVDVAAEGGDVGDVVVPLAVPVRGRVLFEGQAENCWFLEAWQEGRRVASGFARGDGAFELAVLAGPCTLRVSSAWSRWQAPLRELEVVAPADALEIDVRGLGAQVRLELRGVPEGATVDLWEHLPDPDGRPRFEDVTHWGMRTLPVGPGGVVLRRFAPPGQRAWLVDAGAGGAAWTGIVEIPESGELSLGPLQVGFARVVPPAGPGGCDLLLVSPVHGRQRIAAGEVHDGAEHSLLPGPWAALPFAAGVTAGPSSWTEVAAGGSLELICPPVGLGSVAGVVTRDAQPVGDAWVEFRREGRHPHATEPSGTFTDAAGRFEFPAAQAGPGHIVCSEGRERRATIPVDVVAGEGLHLDIVLWSGRGSAPFTFGPDAGPPRDLVAVDVVGWSERVGRPARRLDGETWDAGGSRGRALVAAASARTRHLGGGYSDGVLLGEVDLGRADAEVALYPGTLRVELAPGAALQAPIAYLLEVDGLDACLLGHGWPPALVRERCGTNAFEFRTVPPVARLRLWGLGPDGRPLIREVEIRSGVPAHIAWP